MAKEHQFLHVHKTNCNNMSSDGGRARRLAVHRDFGYSSSSQASIHHLRSYLHFDLCEGEMSQEMGGIFRTKQGYKWLRVLDLEGTYKRLLPKALGKLVHLRYLGLRRTWLNSLPLSFGDLFNLQTLDLKWTSIKFLPSSISRMENLRHLHFKWGECSTDLLHQPNYISFNNLQTLWGVLVPQGTSVANLDQCINLRKLGMEGDLMSHGKELTGTITCIPRIYHMQVHMHLVKLHLEGRILEEFPSFPPNLTTLTLVGSRLEGHSIIVLKILPNLKTLKLWYNSYMGNLMVWYPGFPKLEVLELCWLRIQILDICEGSMPNLEELEINKCEDLRELPSGLQFLNHLKELRLPAMSDHLKERVLPNTGADWYKIAHIPFLRPPLV
ncbi:hypothetical protein GIB67_030608 [Kingdonia uniflora]|uniref:Disease resistance R13L4/SHOC-2-like LRR domain-containing protein n=1 Tax=Kingdonia uniflora TaxID=39325 RepID=A0A7J7LQQ9_9MAGN|nr:hypothetical protein GIB67_030608 [Kingdonia uniflora]